MSATLQAPRLAPPASCTEDSKRNSQLNRRDLLKVGLFSSAALMLPAERVARTQLAIANRMPQSKLPPFFSLPFQRPPVARPFSQVGNVDYYEISQDEAWLPIVSAEKPTYIWGYND